MIYNTYIFNPVRPDFIKRAIETLHRNTDMKHSRVVVVDQTKDGMRLDKVDMVIRPYRNLGFAKSMNEGIINGLRWGSEFITCANDDIEFINSRWWEGMIETFNQSDRIVAVNPMSPREPGWGYGWDHGKYID